MTSFLFDSGRQAFLEGTIAYLTDSIRTTLVDHAIFTPLASTDFVDQLGLNGTGDSIADLGGNIGELTDAAGTFSAAMVGHYVDIQGATTPSNDSTAGTGFLITAFTSATVIEYANPGVIVTEAFAGTWKVYARVGNSGDATIASQPLLASKTSTDGVADAADTTVNNVPTMAALESIVLFKDTGTESTSQLIAKIDVGTGLPVTPNGGDILIQWAATADRIFRL